MNFLPFLSMFSGLAGAGTGVAGMNGMMNAGQGAAGIMGQQGGQQGGQQQQWGQEAMQQGPQALQQTQQAMEFGTQGMPPSLQAQLAQEQGQQQGVMQQQAQPNFDPYVQQGAGMVLPAKGELENPQPNASLFSMPMSSSAQPPQINVGPGQHTASQRPTGDQMSGAPPIAPHQTGFGDIFNPMGSYDMNPNNTQGFDPNMFLRLSQGYNQGGLMGALGMLLTDYHNSSKPQ